MATATSTSTILTDSISSLTSNSSPHHQSVSKVFKQAQQLFISRQLPEAWDVLLPVVTPQPREAANGALSSNGSFHANGEATLDHNGHLDGSTDSGGLSRPEVAPIAQASKTARIKVWSLYIALVHATLELGQTEGSKVMEDVTVESKQGLSGIKRWKDLNKRVRDGEIWEEVVRDGYTGFEGAVEGEVVCNLATLLLTHAPFQKLTQSRLESYLSASRSGPPPSQLVSALQNSSPDASPVKSNTNGQTHSNHQYHNSANGTSTPRDLATRLKLLEIFTLHVLPRNEEWDYAREFINMSEVIDDDRKEAFLAALGTLRDSSAIEKKREEELIRRREEEMHSLTRNGVGSDISSNSTSGVREGDYGIDTPASSNTRSQTNGSTPPPPQSRDGATGPNGSAQPQSQPQSKPRNSATNKSSSIQTPNPSAPAPASAPATSKPKKPNTSASTPSKSSLSKSINSSTSTSNPNSKSSPSSTSKSSNSNSNSKRTPPPQPTFLTRAQHTIQALQRALSMTASSLSRNPMVVLRFLFFLLALIMALGRRDVRERLGFVWQKLRATVGMGAKVGYL